MRTVTLALWSVLVAGVAPSLAQDQQLDPGPAFDQRYDELARWLREYHAWEQWYESWGNRAARNFNGDLISERKKRPEPPVWLAKECQGLLDTDGLLPTACEILEHWDEQPLQILQRRRSSLAMAGGQVNDKVVKSSFFRRVHLTGLWMQAQFPSQPVYGIVGMQVAVVEVGRYTLPAIGAMMVMLPDGKGGHDWKPATTLGVGFRICDFVAPVLRRQASLHINVARTSIHGSPNEKLFPGSTNVNFFGLSVSAAKHHP